MLPCNGQCTTLARFYKSPDSMILPLRKLLNRIVRNSGFITTLFSRQISDERQDRVASFLTNERTNANVSMFPLSFGTFHKFTNIIAKCRRRGFSCNRQSSSFTSCLLPCAITPTAKCSVNTRNVQVETLYIALEQLNLICDRRDNIFLFSVLLYYQPCADSCCSSPV